MTSGGHPTRLGLLGGMSWQSTAVYYRILNELVAERMGGHASAPVTIHSVDFAEIEAAQRAGDWPSQAAILNDAARKLEAAGAGVIALATNTLHLVADRITAGLSVPFLDLIEVVGEAAAAAGYGTVGLLGTAYTMSAELYPSRLARYGVEVIVPDSDDQQRVHEIIYTELVRGSFSPSAKREYLEIIERLAERGAEAVVLGCTEIGLLLTDGEAVVPLLDTTKLHCDALVAQMLKGTPS